MCDDWTRTYTPKLFAPITIKRRRKLAHHMPCWCRHLDLRGLNLNHPCAVFPRRDSDVNILALLFFSFSNFLTMKKKLRDCWIRAVPGTKGRELSFPFSCRAKLFRAKRFKEKRAAAKREIFKKFQQEFQKACQDNLFFSLCCINWCVGLHLCKTSILLQRSRERNSCQSENVVGPGDTETGVSQEVTTNRIKGKIWIARHRRVPPREPEENRSLVDTRVLSRFPTFLQCFFFPESGNANEGIHSTAITRNLFPENCQFNESRLIVYVYSTHQH